MDIDSLTNSFRTSIQNKITDLNVDYSELLLDVLIKNETLKEIPIVKTLVSFAQIGVSIKNQFLIKKILRFLLELDSIPSEKKQQFLSKLDNSNDSKTLLDNLLIIIDRLDHDEKAQILGKLFKSLIEGKIDIDLFFRLINILEKVYIYDLIILNGHSNKKLHLDIRVDYMKKLNKIVKNNLSNHGLMIPVFGGKLYQTRDASDPKEVIIKDYKISSLGLSLIEFGF